MKKLLSINTIAIIITIIIMACSISVYAEPAIKQEQLTLPQSGISAILNEYCDVDELKEVIASSGKEGNDIYLETETVETFYEEPHEEETYAEEAADIEDETYAEEDEIYIADIEDETYPEEAANIEYETYAASYVENEELSYAAYNAYAGETYMEETPYIEEEIIPENIYVEQQINSSSNGIRQQVADLAASLVGVTQYVSAGRSLYATDCSGFVYMLYGQFGIYASPASDDYMNPYFGTLISESELEPGDVVVYYNGGHVGIYEGNGMIVHCSSPENGTMWSDMYFDAPSAFVRISDS